MAVTLAELRALAEPGRGGYSVFDGDYAQMAVTLEDGEFLYALVRLAKPTRVLELGTGLGAAATFIASALAENGSGWLTTFEPNHFYAAIARERLEGLPCDVVEVAPPANLKPDMVFIDSGYDRRESDIASWTGADYNGLVVVHDANRGYAELTSEAGVFLPCADGLWLGRAGG